MVQTKEEIRVCRQKYREENPEKVKAQNRRYSKKYRETNPEKRKKQHKRWREDNPENIKIRNKKYREENPEKVKINKKKCHEKLLEFIRRYKKYCGCKNCGEKDPLILSVHHRNKKNKKKIDRIYNRKELKEELKKCDILCRNCHMKLHSNERENLETKLINLYTDLKHIQLKKEKKKIQSNILKTKKRLYVNSIKKKCRICGEKDYRCLVCHHNDPLTKEKTVSQLVMRNCSIDKIDKEIAKCSVLCGNCHTRLHNLEHEKKKAQTKKAAR